MNIKLKRRDFIARFTVLDAGSIALGTCSKRKEPNESSPESGLTGNRIPENKIVENRAMPRDLVFKQLDMKVYQYIQVSFNFAQSSYLALEDQFGLDGGQVLKALTPLAGIAERGETCGAVLGPLMIFGLLYGRDKNRLDDWDTYRNSLVPSGKFCRLFEQEYGSTMCRDIQTVEFGKCFNLTDPQQLREFQEADATTHCSSVVRKAVRLAAGIILDDTNELK